MKVTEVAQVALQRGELMLNKAAEKIASFPENLEINDIVDLKTGELQYKAGLKLIQLANTLQEEVLKVLE